MELDIFWQPTAFLLVLKKNYLPKSFNEAVKRKKEDRETKLKIER